MTKDTFTFDGFEPANTTPVPDILFDRLLSELSGAELKVLLYIIRRTWGFKKDTDAISLSQFTDGIITREGKVLDKGCGIKNRTTVSAALAELEKIGCIKSDKGDDPLGDKATNLYTIRFKGSTKNVLPAQQGSIENVPPSAESVPPVVSKSHHRSNQTAPRVVSKTYPQETVLQQTDTQETELQERESNSDDTTKPPVVSSDTAHADSLQDEKMFTDEKPQGDDHANCVPALPAANPAASSQPTPPRHTEDNSDGASLPANGLPVVHAVGSDTPSTQAGRDTRNAGRDAVQVAEKGQTNDRTSHNDLFPVNARGSSGSGNNGSIYLDSSQQETLTKTPTTPTPAQSLSPSPQAEQAASGQSKGKGKKQAEPKPETPKSPPVEPPEDMAWGTRKCLMWFDYWRGGILIGKFKLMQASTCAKGLAEQFDEQTVIQARTDMEADPYYAAKGGCDVCDVANNIHKYLKKRQSKVIAFRGKQQLIAQTEDLVEWQGRMMTVTEADTLGFNGGFGAYL